MSDWGLLIYGVAGFLSSIVSGMVGGGGGFIMTPLSIFLGLSPAQAVSTGKFNGLALTVGALGGMNKVRGNISKKRVLPVMVLALIIGLLVPYAIKAFDSKAYRVALGIILLLMIPVLVIKKVGVHRTEPTPAKRTIGGVLLALSLALQGIFSGGLGTLVNLVLIGMLGMTPLEANLTKRWSQLILNVVIIIGVFTSGFIVWRVAVVGISTVLIGGYIGGQLATRKGDEFIMRVMILFMVVSAIALIVNA